MLAAPTAPALTPLACLTDRLRPALAGRERFEKAETCRVMFDELDTDGGGFLDATELEALAVRMGFDLESNPKFVEEMIAQMDNMSTGEIANEEDDEDDGEISRDEFLAWYMNKGSYYLDKPTFETMGLEVPTMAKRKELFLQIGADGSCPHLPGSG
eukprot:SAG22_NODE_5999_length_918_cov_0.794872_1_plen_156_part_10